MKKLLLLLCLTLSPNFLIANYESILNNAELQTYHGWLKYLKHRAESAMATYGATSEEAIEWNDRLNEWLLRIEDDADAIYGVRGVFEWAYESTADDSGQPFSISIPESYDPEIPARLSVHLHGRGGNHYFSDWYEIPENAIVLAVLGRAGAGYYSDLSEIDVLQAIEYVQSHWSIDPENIHLSGSSMGGWGAFYLSNRYPDRFASVIARCGWGENLPVENWKHVPLYSIHSLDDLVVPVTNSRVIMNALAEISENAVYEEPNGYGHNAYQYQLDTGNPERWSEDKRRPALHTYADIDYTAYDGKVRGAFWAEILKWGPMHAPARFIIETPEANHLQISLENIDQLKIDLQAKGTDLDANLFVQIGAEAAIEIEAPLSENLYVIKTFSHFTATLEAPTEPSFPYHFPGGAKNLYDGSPILVVWGTQGEAAENQMIESAAKAARQSSHPILWSEATENEDYRVFENRFGLLKGKPDFEVTDEDLETHHLILIGNERQNSVVSRFRYSLRIALREREVMSSDGIRWHCEEPAVQLTQYNPMNHQKLLHWIACDDTSFYRDGRYITLTSHPYYNTTWGGKDLVVFDWLYHQLVAARNFSSNWTWEAGYRNSPLIPDGYTTFRGVAELEGEAMRTAVAADFSIISWWDINAPHRVAPGQTRIMDLLPEYYGRRIAVMDLTGAELRGWKLACDRFNRTIERFDIVGAIDLAEVDNEQVYSVALDLMSMQCLIETIDSVPDTLRYTDQRFDSFIRDYLGH